MTDWLFERFRERRTRPALLWRDRTVTYGELLDDIARWRGELAARGIGAGDSIALIGDYSPASCGLLLALVANRNVAVPLAADAACAHPGWLDIACVSWVFDLTGAAARAESRPAGARHPLLDRLRASGEPGLVLFSSGSRGAAKAALHSFDRVCGRLRNRSGGLPTLAFLLLDHIGGVNTLCHVLAGGGALVTPEARTPDAVCAAIARHGVALLPTTPTFLTMLLLSEAHRRHDLSSLRLITYGTEAMPPATLRAVADAFPEVRLKQTYGLSELGILATASRDSASTWVRVGGDGYETTVVDGLLRIRSRWAMLGYLNAPTPFDDDGWFNTEDVVETDGEYLRILGRASDAINVGGQKVYPAEVEGVLLQMENIRDATVRGRANPVMGQVVSASVHLERAEEPAALQARIRAFCAGRLEAYKVPMVVEIGAMTSPSRRFKKPRTASA